MTPPDLGTCDWCGHKFQRRGEVGRLSGERRCYPRCAIVRVRDKQRLAAWVAASKETDDDSA
jgi:hypothetical protein